MNNTESSPSIIANHLRFVPGRPAGVDAGRRDLFEVIDREGNVLYVIYIAAANGPATDHIFEVSVKPCVKGLPLEKKEEA